MQGSPTTHFRSMVQILGPQIYPYKHCIQHETEEGHNGRLYSTSPTVRSPNLGPNRQRKENATNMLKKNGEKNPRRQTTRQNPQRRPEEEDEHQRRNNTSHPYQMEEGGPRHEDGPKQMGAQNNMEPKNRPQKRRTPKTKMGRRSKTPLWTQLDYEGQGPTSMEGPNSISKRRLMKTCQEPDHQGRPKHPPHPEATTVGGGTFPHWLRGTARLATLPAKRPLPTGLNLNLYFF